MSKPQSYVPLHLHTHYSIMDSIIKPKALGNLLNQLNIEHCVISDHGVVSGLIEFQKEMKAAGVHPLLGAEVYCTYDEDGLTNDQKTKDNYHLIVIAIDNIGLKNLFWLVSNANARNFYYKPRVSFQNLAKYSEGLVCCSACLGGLVAKSKTEEEREERIKLLSSIFKDRFFLEVQPHEFEEQIEYNDYLIAASKRYNLPLVVTTDAHYLLPEDNKTHSIAMAQQLGMTLDQYNKQDKMKYKGNYSVWSPERMMEAAAKLRIEEAVSNTVMIAEKCTAEIETGIYKMPSFDHTKEKDYEDFKRWLREQQ